ncbi:hypothetical protein JCM17380_16980 [Desulfosporosinus burensis]
MFSLFRKKQKNNEQQGSEGHDKTRQEEEERRETEQKLAEEKRETEQRLQEDKIKHQEVLRQELAEKRSVREQRLLEEKAKHQELVKQELSRLRSINYIELMLGPVNIMNDEQTELIRTDLKISYDDINLHQFEFGGKTIQHQTNGIILVEQGESDGNETLIFLHENEQIITYFKIANRRIEELREYYNKVNEIIRRKQSDFELKVSSCVSEMKAITEIYTLCYNFIGKNNLALYYDPDYICSMEQSIRATTSRIGEGTLICPRRVEIQNFKAFEEIKNFLGNDFLALFQILAPRFIGFPKDENGTVNLDKALYIIWKLLRTIAEDYFCNLLLDTNPSMKQVIKASSLEDCILFYSRNNYTSSAVDVAALAYYLLREGKFENRDLTILDCLGQVLMYLGENEKVDKLRRFEEELLNSNITKKLTISDIDLMSGLEFENFVARLFESMGFRTEVTKASGDQGIDVIAEKDGSKFGIQAKCYSSSVTNKAIQEVVAGINHYNLNKGIVITNNFFTESAAELAKTNNIILWDRNMLKEKIADLA